MNKLANKLLITSVIVLIIFLFTNFSAKSAPVRIEFWHAMGGYRGKVIDSLIKKFNDSHPNIYVEGKFKGITDVVKDKYNNDYNVLFQELLISIVTNSSPVVAQVYENWTTQFLMVDAIVPMENFIKSSSGGLSDKELNDFVPIFLQSNIYDGKIWTLPFNKSIYVLYYNKDYFTQAGVEPPRTWEELKEIATKLTIKNNEGKVERYALIFLPNVDCFSHIFLANGGEFISDKGEAVFNSVEGVKTLEYLQALVNSGVAIPSFEHQKDFLQGKSAIFIETTSKIGSFRKEAKFPFGVAPLPSVEGHPHRVLFAGTNLAIFKQKHTQEEQLAAWEFVKWLTSPEITTEWAIQTGYIPVRSSAIKSAEYQKYLKEDPLNYVGVEELPYAIPAPRVSSWQSIRGIIDDIVFSTVSLNETIQEALNEGVALANKFLSPY